MSLEMLSAVWNLDLERNEKDVLEVLAWHSNADGICWPSRARIMYTKGLSESVVKRTIRSLKKKGLITVEAHAEGGRGKTPLYKLHPEKGANKPPFEEWKQGQKGARASSKRGPELRPPNRHKEPLSKGDSLRSSPAGGESDDSAPAMELGQYLVKYTYDVIEEYRTHGKDPAPEDPVEIRKTGRIAKQAIQRKSKPITVERAEEAITRQVERACGMGGPKAWIGFHTALAELEGKSSDYGKGRDGKARRIGTFGATEEQYRPEDYNFHV